MSLKSSQSDFRWSDLDGDTIHNLHVLLEGADGIKYAIMKERHGVWFTSAEEDKEAELRLLTFLCDSLIVSRVQFHHRRCGIMTRVFAELEQFCQRNGVKKIIVQSVQTPEMASWCEKNGFKPAPVASHFYHGFIMGDWEYVL